MRTEMARQRVVFSGVTSSPRTARREDRRFSRKPRHYLRRTQTGQKTVVVIGVFVVTAMLAGVTAFWASSLSTDGAEVGGKMRDREFLPTERKAAPDVVATKATAPMESKSCAKTSAPRANKTERLKNKAKEENPQANRETKVEQNKHAEPAEEIPPIPSEKKDLKTAKFPSNKLGLIGQFVCGAQGHVALADEIWSAELTLEPDQKQPRSGRILLKRMMKGTKPEEDVGDLWLYFPLVSIAQAFRCEAHEVEGKKIVIFIKNEKVGDAETYSWFALTSEDYETVRQNALSLRQ